MSRHRVVTILFLVLLTGMILLHTTLALSAGGYVVLVIAYVTITAYGASSLSLQYFVQAHTSGPRTGNTIALTFDDGPLPGMTERIMDILKERSVQGAFFCIGSRAEANPELIKRIDNEGHLLGNHSFHHGKMFDLLPADHMIKELSDTDNVLKKITGRSPRFFRPPYGVTNPMVAKAVKERRYQVIGWSIRSFDTVTRDKKKLLRRITRSLRSGDIVLFHDYSETMIAALPEFIDHVAKVGLKIVRVDRLLDEKGYVEHE